MTALPKIFPLGDNALTIDFGNEISLELNSRAVTLASAITSSPFKGFVEAVPAYSSVAVFYDPQIVREAFPISSAFERVRAIVVERLKHMETVLTVEARSIQIAVDFSSEAALDADFIATHCGLSFEEVIAIFLSRTYRVYMLGFLPGFAYMGEVDERIASPRQPSPRLKVPKGSVGIAGVQTGIYPLESPGGWQIIGRTEIEIFTPAGGSPCLLRPGDEVRFLSI